MKKVLLYPALSYKIVGLVYEVFNQLRYGHKEKIYQIALAKSFQENKLNFKRELYFPIVFNGATISRYYFDFLVDDKIVLELKVANNFYSKDINQLLSYLKFKNYHLGMLIIFTKNGVSYKRIAN